jgi:ABC-2 type transport system permease protein
MTTLTSADRLDTVQPISPSRRPAGALTGTGTLVRLALRRDRVRLPAWLVGVVGFLTLSAVSVPEVFPTAAERQARGDFARSPVLTIFTGPGYGTDDYTVGAMVANEYLIYGVVALALMSIFLVVRHTRAEEEAGRVELVRSSVVGAHAAPTAALVVAVGANLAIGSATALTLTAAMPELAAAGAWAFGLSMAAAGIVFAAVAAVTAQLTEHSRGAVGLAVVALGVAFVVRAVGDIGDDRTLSWFSPIGWLQSTRPWVAERWWPLLPALLFALVLAALAYVLASRRDVAAGLLPARPGPARAADPLVHPAGLALRLERTSLGIWAVGLFAFGAAFGSLLGEVEGFLADNPQLQELFGAAGDATVVDAFLTTVLLLLGLLAGGYTLTVTLRAHRDERAGLAEPLLATPLSRVRWAGTNLMVAAVAGSVVMLAAAAGAGTTAATERGDITWLGELLGAGLVHLPALWLLVGVGAALTGLLPRATALSWIVLVYAAVVGLMGDVLDLPDGLRAGSPFHHVPELPGGEVDATALAGLALLAAILIGLGLAGFRRRDLHTT